MAELKRLNWLREQKGLEISYRTLVRYLHEHDYAINDGEALTDKLLESLQGVLNDTKLVCSVCSLPSLNRK
jgi:hypothetical protein